MKIDFYWTNALMLFALIVFCGGCGAKKESDDSGANDESDHSSSAAHENEHGGHDDHVPEHDGPHGGHVIELGRSHKYHAELVEDEKAESVTVYILDKDLKELAIEQPSIAMNVTVDGQAESFQLMAEGANARKASSFKAADHAPFEALHEHDATGKLRVTIADTPYTAEVGHHHHDGEQDAHEHDHEDDHKH